MPIVDRMLQYLPIFAVLMLAGCQMPTAPQITTASNVVTDPAVRQMVSNLVARSTRARQAGGMVGVSADIQSC